MDIALILVTISTLVAAGAFVRWLWRTVVDDGAGRNVPQHAHAHWSRGDVDSLPDSPYRSLDRVA